MANGYKINRSNYTIRRRHRLVNDGQVTERDFMTTTNLGPWDSGSIPYGESNFRMFYRNPENVRKKNIAGTWLKSPCGEDTEFWDGTCIEKSGVTEEVLIKEKPNYKSLLDFAYFGSCVELVKSTIRKTINEFPGELNIYTKEPFEVDGQKYLVNNQFAIDIFGREDNDGLKNFFKNYNEYVAVIGDNVYPIVAVTVSEVNPDACEHGDVVCTAVIRYGSSNISISETIYDTKPMLFTTSNKDVHIRPKEEHLDKFFENLDDFGKMLLNRDSSPKYTATIDWPHETDAGVMTYEKSFTWPVEKGGWNLDISSSDYEKYVADILSIAEFYDKGYTNNLWRMLTHDSVKNMDITFSNPEKDEDKEDYNDGTTRLQGLLWAFGRQFDDIKRYIDNVKRTSTISYDENGNMPDYFLTDSLELAGWETYNVDEGIENSGVSVNWGEVERKYTSEDANNTFMRELKLNSKNIFSKKGTVDGIVSLLGLFGMVSGVDYEIKEHVAVVNGMIEKSDIDNNFKLSTLNGYKASSETSYPDQYNEFDGIPFTYVVFGNKKYIIPWFDSSLRYDGGTYFQMNGGWMKDMGKFDNPYEETIKYLSVVDNISDMYSLPMAKRRENAICYVENVENATEHADHYFKLTDVDNFDNVSGWTRPSTDEITYIDGIIDDYTGNNPHVGYGNYDDGEEYLERIKFPFKPTEEFLDGAYDCDGNLDTGYTYNWVKIGDAQEDNKKVWFFGEVSGGTLAIDYNVFDFEKGTNGQVTTTPSEAAANSVINVKTIDFEFSVKAIFANEFREYLNKSILPYLKQMIPSTAIWTVTLNVMDAVHVEPDYVVSGTTSIFADGVAFRSGEINDDFIANYDANKWTPYEQSENS
ncbi:MAG: hypothetical protein J6X18_00280 [Bacteroidales bacterium]|nr:hypothetical protein [Bacteroidales bacterium]